MLSVPLPHVPHHHKKKPQPENILALSSSGVGFSKFNSSAHHHTFKATTHSSAARTHKRALRQTVNAAAVATRFYLRHSAGHTYLNIFEINASARAPAPVASASQPARTRPVCFLRAACGVAWRPRNCVRLCTHRASSRLIVLMKS